MAKSHTIREIFTDPGCRNTGVVLAAVFRPSGAGVRSGIRTRSQPWPSRSTASCALLNADTARLTVLLDT